MQADDEFIASTRPSAIALRTMPDCSNFLAGGAAGGCGQAADKSRWPLDSEVLVISRPWMGPLSSTSKGENFSRPKGEKARAKRDRLRCRFGKN